MRIERMAAENFREVISLWENTAGMGLNPYDDSEEGLMRYLARNPSTCFVTRDEDGRVAGSILAGHDGRRAFIYHLAVAMGSRNRGVGKSLVEAAVQALHAEGIAKVALVMYADNDGGNAF